MTRDLIAIYGPPGSGKSWLADRIEGGDPRSSVTINDAQEEDLRRRLRACRAYFDLVIVTSASFGVVEGLGFKPTMIITVSRRTKGGRK
jgi:hypothetical protein